MGLFAKLLVPGVTFYCTVNRIINIVILIMGTGSLPTPPWATDDYYDGLLRPCSCLMVIWWTFSKRCRQKLNILGRKSKCNWKQKNICCKILKKYLIARKNISSVPVLCVVWAGVVGPHDDEHVLELGPDVGDEGQGAGLLREYDDNW